MVFVLALLLSCPLALAAQSPSPEPQAPTAQTGQRRNLPGEDPSLLLGAELGQALERFGLPESMYPVRGSEAWQDDVVFQYPSGFSLFWFSGRVWQVRLSQAYAGPAFGVYLGDAPDKIVSLLGPPYLSEEGGYVFNLPGRNFPVRMRVYVKDGKAADIYVYRADF